MFFNRRQASAKRRSIFNRPSLDQELAELIESSDNSTGIALEVKQYLLDVLSDDKNDAQKYSTARLAQGQNILDKAGGGGGCDVVSYVAQPGTVASVSYTINESTYTAPQIEYFYSSTYSGSGSSYTGRGYSADANSGSGGGGTGMINQLSGSGGSGFVIIAIRRP